MDFTIKIIGEGDLFIFSNKFQSMEEWVKRDARAFEQSKFVQQLI